LTALARHPIICAARRNLKAVPVFLALPVSRSRPHRWGCLLALVLAGGCTQLELEDCPSSGVLGVNAPSGARLRTSRHRVLLEHTDMAASRFLAYSLMSAYAYRVKPGCPEKPGSLDEPAASQLIALLAHTIDPTEAADPSRGWTVDESGANHGCEDAGGLMFHVWTRRPVTGPMQVVIAFRGTSGASDWAFGNAWPLLHKFLSNNQYEVANAQVTRIIEFYSQAAAAAGEPPPRFLTTGHSLGGGLAEHVLYTHPSQIEQAIVFDPSSITGFSAIGDEQLKVQGCACQDQLFPEARLMRVYQTYEVLTGLRIFHKMIFPPERHVQEVRFNFPASQWNAIARHAMHKLALDLHQASGQYVSSNAGLPWYASSTPACTVELEKGQAYSCSKPAGGDHPFCPQ
jgi:predicted esterase